jgi:hypothetical protein
MSERFTQLRLGPKVALIWANGLTDFTFDARRVVAGAVET